MPKGPIKTFLKNVDVLFEPIQHERAQSVLGGLLTLLAAASGLFYLIFVIVVRDDGFTPTSQLVETQGQVFVLRFNNTIPQAARLAYTFPRGSSCYNAFEADSRFEPYLNWTLDNPGALEYALPQELPVCQDYTSLTGVDSANAVRNGLVISSFYRANVTFWVTVVSPDGTVSPLPFRNNAREVPVHVTLEKQTDRTGAALFDSWVPSTSVGISFDNSRCLEFVPYTSAFTCDSVVVTTAASFIVYGETKNFVDDFEWWFARLLVLSLILNVASFIKLTYRRIKHYREDGDEEQTPTEQDQELTAVTVGS